LEKGYIKTDEHYRTGHPDVYAAGDVIGNFLLAHVAYYEGEHIMEHIAGKNPKPLDYNRVPRATYTYPQVASLGLSEKQARDQGLKVKVGKFPLVGNAKSVILGETEGFVKIISDEESDELVGVFIIGPNATELIAETALAKLLESTPFEIGASIAPHPTVSESVKEAALAVDGVAIHI
jgi:dihydrolipoamide dehydrogenase